MARKITSDGYAVLDNGKKFKVSSATRWEESRWFDGRNMISRATCSEWYHQSLYRTAKGRWVIHAWSDVPYTSDTWFEVSKRQAARWLIKNCYEPHPDVAAEYAALKD